MKKGPILGLIDGRVCRSKGGVKFAHHGLPRLKEHCLVEHGSESTECTSNSLVLHAPLIAESETDLDSEELNSGHRGYRSPSKILCGQFNELHLRFPPRRKNEFACGWFHRSDPVAEPTLPQSRLKEKSHKENLIDSSIFPPYSASRILSYG